MLAQLGKLVLGGLCGAGLGGLVVAFTKQANGSTLIPGMALSGIVLGWQPVVHVFLIFMVLQLFVRYLPMFRTLLSARPTALLLLAVLIHHPMWKYLLQQFSMLNGG